ncbi:hypothetical protein PHET_00790 [Paragonimus heterotremus]|uniref:Uncharacterized protein n=1 Tax=Paragonimus heterotremus TaxID=100268 RepID=A0A8J4ST68_9TREM|nr:hypothetical protein PHET_00790 [Paragonimus heterotremus]
MIQLPDGKLVAPGSETGDRYFVVQPDTPAQPALVFDRLTGEQLTDVQIDRHGVLHLPDGSKAVQTSTTLDRYLVVVDPQDGVTSVFDRRTGEQLEGAVLETSGLIRLPSGFLVAPSSSDGSKLLALFYSDGSSFLLYDRFSGHQLVDFLIDVNGLIRLANGSFAILPSLSGDRFVVHRLPVSGSLAVFDRRSGCLVNGEILGSSGFFRFPDRTLVALSNSSAGRFLLLNVSAEDVAVVFDRHTGMPLPGAEVLFNEIISMPNGSLSIVQSNYGARFVVVSNFTPGVNYIFDRRSGELLTGARLHPSGLIELADGKVYATAHPGNFRYLVARDPTGHLDAFDAISGERLQGAKVLEDGFIQLGDGEIVAPGRVEGARFVVRAITDGIGQLTVFDSVTGLVIPDAFVRADGLIQFGNGVLFPTIASALESNRYFVLKNSTTQEVTVFDLVTGSQVDGITLDETGQYRLRDGTIINLTVEDKLPETVKPPTVLEPDHVTSDRERMNETDLRPGTGVLPPGSKLH